MNIRKVAENKVKITLSQEDMQKMGLTFEDLDSDEITARVFIGSLLKLMEETGIFKVEKGDIQVEITRKKSGDIVIIICLINNFPENIWSAYFFDDCEKLVEFCKNVLCEYNNYNDYNNYSKIISNSLLFQQGNFYILMVNFTIDNNTFAKNKVLSENSITDTVKIAKIKEYAKLISRTPLEKISEIF